MRHAGGAIRSVSVVAFLLGGPLGARAVDVPGDHYLCYKVVVAKVPANTPPILKPVKSNILLSDQFETGKHYDAFRILSVCNPATKTHGASVFTPVHSSVYMVGYQLKNTAPEKEDTGYKTVPHLTFDQFGTLKLNAIAPDSLLVRSLETDLGAPTKCKSPDTANVCPPSGRVCDPAAKICLPSPLPPLGTPPGDASGVNNFKCYKIRDNKMPAFAPTQATVKDDFSSPAGFAYDVVKPTKLCTPVDKEGEGTVDPYGHLVCYLVHPAKTPPQPKFAGRKADTRNANLGDAYLDVKVVKELCLPATKDAPPTTTSTSTTTTTSTSTTTITIPPGCCGPMRIITQSTGRCLGHCSNDATTTCQTDSICGTGNTCLGRTPCLDDGDCPGGGTCLSDGTLGVSTLPPFTFPLGVVTTIDAGPPDADCKHDAIVPFAGFFVPIFTIPPLNFCSKVEPQGCESGGTFGSGTVWDAAAPGATVTANITHSGDTRDGLCDPTTAPCDTLAGSCSGDPTFRCPCAGIKRCSADTSANGHFCTANPDCRTCNAGTRTGLYCTTDSTAATTGCPGATCPGCCVSVQTCVTLPDKGPCDTSQAGAGANSMGRIITTRSGPGAPGVNTQLGIPVRSTTWQDSTGSGDLATDCATDFDVGAGDTVVTQFDFILTPTTGTGTAQFADQNADGCSRAGSGPQGPQSLTGMPATGPCCSEGQTTTVVSLGVAFTGAQPLYDILFKSTIPSRITTCGTWPGAASCLVSSDICKGP